MATQTAGGEVVVEVGPRSTGARVDLCVDQNPIQPDDDPHRGGIARGRPALPEREVAEGRI